MARSKHLESRLARFSQPKVSSTIQRFFCRTNLPRGRVTISTHQNHWTHAKSKTDQYVVSAEVILGNLTDSWNASRASLAPSRSCTYAGVTTNVHASPSVSTTTYRLRPGSFFGVVAARPALLGCLGRLAVEDRRGRFRGSPRLLANRLAGLLVEQVPCAVRLPSSEPVKHEVVR